MYHYPPPIPTPVCLAGSVSDAFVVSCNVANFRLLELNNNAVEIISRSGGRKNENIEGYP